MPRQNSYSGFLVESEGVSAYSPLPFQLLRQVSKISLQMNEGKHDFEPDSSGFHLEVAAVLDQLRVSYFVERPEAPFVLDLVLRGQPAVQVEAPRLEPEMRARSRYVFDF